MDAQERRDYDRARWQDRRRKLVYLLGGKCVGCGTSEDLDFDHVDPETKAFSISSGLFKPWKILLTEAAKCQLLCHPCHIQKTNDDGKTVDHGGGLSGKRNCPCEPCRERKREYMREWKRTRKAGSSNGRAAALQAADEGPIPSPATTVPYPNERTAPSAGWVYGIPRNTWRI